MHFAYNETKFYKIVLYPQLLTFVCVLRVVWMKLFTLQRLSCCY